MPGLLDTERGGRMTREEAIKVLKCTLPYTSEFAEARTLAIESLEAWDVVESEYKEFHEKYDNLTDFGKGYCSALAWVTRVPERKAKE